MARVAAAARLLHPLYIAHPPPLGSPVESGQTIWPGTRYIYVLELYL